MGARTLLVPDVIGWAFYRMMMGIQRWGPSGVMVIQQEDVDRSELASYGSHLMCSWSTWGKPDKARTWGLVANEGVTQEYGPPYDTYQKRMATQLKNAQAARIALPKFKGLISTSPRIVPFLKAINPNTHYLQTGVDHDTFKVATEPFKERTVRIGWCGKPSTVRSFSPKGYEEVFIPVRKVLASDYRLEFVVNNKTLENRLTTSEMVAWYNSIDVMLITSCSETGPLTALEALSCGRPVIATNVGILSEFEAVAREKTGVSCVKIVPTYSTIHEAAATTEALISEIRQVLRDRQTAINAGRVAREVVKDRYSWAVLANEWIKVLRGSAGTGVGPAAPNPQPGVAGSARRAPKK